MHFADGRTSQTATLLSAADALRLQRLLEAVADSPSGVPWVLPIQDGHLRPDLDGAQERMETPLRELGEVTPPTAGAATSTTKQQEPSGLQEKSAGKAGGKRGGFCTWCCAGPAEN
jgi:hypothetical protein|eukprot:COSAG01_NODE_1869_length_9019_cov_6.883072_3_plen_116_part_00